MRNWERYECVACLSKSIADVMRRFLRQRSYSVENNKSAIGVYMLRFAFPLCALIFCVSRAHASPLSHDTTSPDQIIPAFPRSQHEVFAASKPVQRLDSVELLPAVPPLWASKPVGGRNYLGGEFGFSFDWLGGASNWFFPVKVGDIFGSSAVFFRFASGGSGIGWHVGGVGDFAFSNKVSIDGKLWFASNSTSSTDTRIETGNGATGGKVTSTYATTLNYLGLGMMARYQISPDSWYLLGGLGFSFLIGNSFEASQTTEGGPASINVAPQSAPYWNSSRSDIRVGCGTFVPIGDNGKMLTPELILLIPTTQVFDNGQVAAYRSLGAEPPKLWSISLSVALMFPWEQSSDSSIRAIDSIRESPSTNSSTPQLVDRRPHVSGRVHDQKTGTAIEAAITVVDLDSNNTVANGNTQDGKYDLAVPRPGHYSVTAERNNYLFGSTLFDVDSEGVVANGNHDITLSEALEGRTKLLVFFEFGKAELQPTSYPELNRAANLMQSSPTMRVEIAGYTDNVGTEQYNKDLALRRAEAVRNYLVNAGIIGTRITAEGYGDADPIAPNTTEAGRAENRRVEFVVARK